MEILVISLPQRECLPLGTPSFLKNELWGYFRESKRPQHNIIPIKLHKLSRLRILGVLPLA